MDIEFRTGDGSLIETWKNWCGVIPVSGDIVLLHFGDNNEIEEAYKVVNRVISGTDPYKVIIYLEWA